MSKPPFRIPTRAGIQLWPRTIQLPTATSYTFEGEGDTADERAAAIEYARRNCEENDGKIKQFYLRVRTAVEVSNMTYFKQSCKIAPGITATFISNYGNEILQVHSTARATIKVNEKPKKLRSYPNVDVMWIFDTTGSSGGGVDLIFNFPALYATISTLRERIPENVARYGMASQGDYPVDPYGHPGDLPYFLNTPLGAPQFFNYLKTNVGNFLYPFEGNDTPEAQFDAIQQCALDGAVGWRAPIKFIILSTDAPVHEGGIHTTFAQMCAVLRARNMHAFMLNGIPNNPDNDVFQGFFTPTDYREAADMLATKMIRIIDPNYQLAAPT